jgi:hypothetical protein
MCARRRVRILRQQAHATKARIWATMGGAQRGRAGRVGVAACRVAGHLPSRDPTLGCAGHYCASAHTRPQASARCNPLMARSADHGGAHVPCTRRLGATVGSQERRSTTATTRTWIVQELRAVAGDFTRDSVGLRPGPERAWCVATIVLAHARPRHARSARPSGVQRRSTRRGGGASTVPCTSIHGSTEGSHTSSSHGDGGAQGHEWPRSSFPSRCGSSAARTPAHRQGNPGDASQRRRSITGKRPSGRKGKGGRGGAHDGAAV